MPPGVVQTPIVTQNVTQISKIIDPPVQPAKATPVQSRFQISDELRSAIAEVVSQRQELLDSQLDGCQIFQRDFSDSDYAPSNDEEEDDDDEENFSMKTRRNGRGRPQTEEKEDFSMKTRSNGRGRPQTDSSATQKEQNAPVSGDNYTAQNDSSTRPLNTEDPPAVSKAPTTPSSLEVAGSLMAGHIPALLQTIDSAANLERKRVFLRAKQLVFEQFKCVVETELQQQEVALLRREMETRESFAHMEIELKRMDIRGEIIQRMILAGASAEDIAERLKLLQVAGKVSTT